MDRSQLTSLKRSQLQQLAKRDNLKGNSKNAEIIRLLLKKYPGGVPKLTEEIPASKRSAPPPSKAKGAVRRSKRKSMVKSRRLSVKAERASPDVRVEPAFDESDGPRKGRDARSMAPPPVTPTASFYLQPPMLRRLPTTPRIDATSELQAENETGKVADTHNAARSPEATPTPPETVAPMTHRVHEMLRNLTDIIDTVSLNPEEQSSFLYRAKAVNTILDTTILPRMMKVDKDVKDIIWMRAAMEANLGPRFKEDGVLPGSSLRHKDPSILHIRPNIPLSAPRSPPHKRPREEQGDERDPAQPRTSKRTRIQ